MTEEHRSDLPVPSDDRRPAPQVGRRFRDDEAAQILRRASSQELLSNLPSPHDSTLDDLVAAAQEVGMDPAAVRRAAMVSPLPESGAQAWVFGGQASRTVRGAIEGPIPVDRGALARTTESIVGKAGSVVKSEPGTWAWESKGGVGRTAVLLKEEGGRTDVTVQGGRADLLALTYMSALVGVAAISGSFGLFATVAATMGPLASLIGLFGVPLLLTRFIFGRLDRGSKDRLEHLTMELLRVAEESPGDGEAPAAEAGS